MRWKMSKWSFSFRKLLCQPTADPKIARPMSISNGSNSSPCMRYRLMRTYSPHSRWISRAKRREEKAPRSNVKMRTPYRASKTILVLVHSWENRATTTSHQLKCPRSLSHKCIKCHPVSFIRLSWSSKRYQSQLSPNSKLSKRKKMIYQKIIQALSTWTNSATSGKKPTPTTQTGESSSLSTNPIKVWCPRSTSTPIATRYSTRRVWTWWHRL